MREQWLKEKAKQQSKGNLDLYPPGWTVLEDECEGETKSTAADPPPVALSQHRRRAGASRHTLNGCAHQYLGLVADTHFSAFWLALSPTSKQVFETG